MKYQPDDGCPVHRSSDPVSAGIDSGLSDWKSVREKGWRMESNFSQLHKCIDVILRLSYVEKYQHGLEMFDLLTFTAK